MKNKSFLLGAIIGGVILAWGYFWANTTMLLENKLSIPYYPIVSGVVVLLMDLGPVKSAVRGLNYRNFPKMHIGMAIWIGAVGVHATIVYCQMAEVLGSYLAIGPMLTTISVVSMFLLRVGGILTISIWRPWAKK